MSLTTPSSSASLKPQLVLTLFPDDPADTTLFHPSGAAMYTVRTDPAAATTRVLRARATPKPARPVAALHVRPGFAADVVVWADHAPRLLRDWLRVHPLSARRCEEAYVLDDDAGRRYQWRGRWNRQQWLLEMFAMDAPSVPIARFTRSHLDFDASPTAPPEIDASLTLSARAVEIQDLCVASCLFLERLHRVHIIDPSYRPASAAIPYSASA